MSAAETRPLPTDTELAATHPVEIHYNYDPVRSMQAQIENGVKGLLESFGSKITKDGQISLQGAGWIEGTGPFEEDNKFIITGDTNTAPDHMTKQELLAQKPAFRKTLLPRFSRHKRAGRNEYKFSRTGVVSAEDEPKSYLTIERRALDDTLLSVTRIEREELFKQLSGYPEGRIRGFFFTPSASGDTVDDTKPRVKVPITGIEFGPGKPSAYNQIMQKQEEAGLDSGWLGLNIEKNGKRIKIVSDETAQAVTTYGSLSRRSWKAEVYDISTGELVRTDVYSDNTEPTSIAAKSHIHPTPAPRPAPSPMETFINNVAKGANAYFDVEAIETETGERERAAYRFLGRLPGSSMPEYAPSYSPISKEDAIDLLAGIDSSAPITEVKLQKRKDTKNMTAPHLLNSLQEITRKIDKDGLIDLANNLRDAYIRTATMLKIPLNEDDLSNSWAVSSLAEEFFYANNPASAKAFNITRPVGNPIGNDTEAHLKQLEIIDLRLGRSAYDRLAPWVQAWGKVAEEHTGEEKPKLNKVRRPNDRLLLEVEPRTRWNIQQIINQTMIPKERASKSFDKELSEMGRLLRRSVDSAE